MVDLLYAVFCKFSKRSIAGTNEPHRSFSKANLLSIDIIAILFLFALLLIAFTLSLFSLLASYSNKSLTSVLSIAFSWFIRLESMSEI